jgi:hypothetical protein
MKEITLDDVYVHYIVDLIFRLDLDLPPWDFWAACEYIKQQGWAII